MASVWIRVHSFSVVRWVGAVAVIWDTGLVLKIFVKSAESRVGSFAHSSRKLSKVAFMSFSSIAGLWVVVSWFCTVGGGSFSVTGLSGGAFSNAGGSGLFSRGGVTTGASFLGNSGGRGM